MLASKILVQTTKVVNSSYSDLTLDDSTLPFDPFYMEHHSPWPTLEWI